MWGIKSIIFVMLIASSLSARAQYDPRCDCTFQGGDKRAYNACNADIDVRPIKRSSSAITDYLIDAKVDTEQCSIVYYDVYSDNGAQKRKQINVVDGSNSEMLSGETYSSIPDIRIKDCVVCKDKRFDRSTGEKSHEHLLSNDWCTVKNSKYQKVEMSLDFTSIDTVRKDAKVTLKGEESRSAPSQRGDVSGVYPDLVIDFDTGSTKYTNQWKLTSATENQLRFTATYDMGRGISQTSHSFHLCN